ncbi:28 kda a-kinase anchor [Cystoisospora suis]|uniref:28 kDa a-kinase anchor n=1 Tax=Cystoisospora suis TaxID=483139 RepID=A0A2C6KJ74_9APIC|nr:28 kda a-kinase anchor [Cystoisospora suis]
MEASKTVPSIPRLSLLASSDSLAQIGRTYLVQLVQNCSKKYEFTVQFVERNPVEDAFEYEVTFSNPTPAKPVPEAEAHVHFQLKPCFLQQLHASQLTGREGPELLSTAGRSSVSSTKSEQTPGLVFWFESQNLKHTLERTLAPGKFEGWIDRQAPYVKVSSAAAEGRPELRTLIIRDKLELRRQHNLRTAFEVSRMSAAPTGVSDLIQEQKMACLQEEQQADFEARAAARREALAAAAAEAAREAERESRFGEKDLLTPRMLFETPQEELPLEQILQKVFYAADEEREGKLPHKAIADLLLASPLGLQRWDLLLLLASAAHEDRQGYINYREFVEMSSSEFPVCRCSQQAPNIIRILRERRKATSRANPCHVTDEAVQLSYKDEMEETWRVMREIFESADASAATSGKLSRGTFLECLQSRPERFSAREITLLMQIAPTDESGCVDFYTFPTMLRILRRESINHAVLEVDNQALNEELVAALNKVYVATERTPRRLHGRATAVRLHSFYGKSTAARLPVSAECIAREAADAAARAEIEELQGLTGGKGRRKQSTKEVDAQKIDSSEDSEQGELPDKETVEKTLIHLFTVIDDKRRGMISIQTFISTMRYWTASLGSSNLGQNSRSSPNQLQQAPSQQHPSRGGGVGGSLPPSSPTGTSNHQGSPKGGGTSAGRRPLASPGPGNGNNGVEPNGKTGPGNSSVSATGPAGSAAAAAERRYADVVASCRLSAEEITGILAEVEIDEHQQEVSYQDHIRTWIPIVFEIR